MTRQRRRRQAAADLIWAEGVLYIQGLPYKAAYANYSDDENKENRWLEGRRKGLSRIKRHEIRDCLERGEGGYLVGRELGRREYRVDYHFATEDLR